MEPTVATVDPASSGSLLSDQTLVTLAVQVVITLSDINDHPPAFDSKKLEFSRTEGWYDNVSLTVVEARDADIGPNSDLAYSIIGSSQGLFTLQHIMYFL